MAATKHTGKIKSWLENRDHFTGWDEAYVTDDEVALAATELNLRQSEILAALDELDVDYDNFGLDDAETAAHEKYLESLRPAERPEITALKLDLAKRASVDRDEIDQLAEKHGLTWKAVAACAIRLGKFDVDTHLQIRAVEAADAEKAAATTKSSEVKNTPDRDTQYGVLQPAANLAGGCLYWWLWLIIIFALLAVGVSIFGGG